MQKGRRKEDKIVEIGEWRVSGNTATADILCGMFKGGEYVYTLENGEHYFVNFKGESIEMPRRLKPDENMADADILRYLAKQKANEITARVLKGETWAMKPLDDAMGSDMQEVITNSVFKNRLCMKLGKARDSAVDADKKEEIDACILAVETKYNAKAKSESVFGE